MGVRLGVSLVVVSRLGVIEIQSGIEEFILSNFIERHRGGSNNTVTRSNSRQVKECVQLWVFTQTRAVES